MMLLTYDTLKHAIEAAATMRGDIEIYAVYGRYTFDCTSKRCEPVAIRVDGEWTIKAVLS